MLSVSLHVSRRTGGRRSGYLRQCECDGVFRYVLFFLFSRRDNGGFDTCHRMCAVGTPFSRVGLPASVGRNLPDICFFRRAVRSGTLGYPCAGGVLVFGWLCLGRTHREPASRLLDQLFRHMYTGLTVPSIFANMPRFPSHGLMHAECASSICVLFERGTTTFPRMTDASNDSLA